MEKTKTRGLSFYWDRARKAQKTSSSSSPMPREEDEHDSLSTPHENTTHFTLHQDTPHSNTPHSNTNQENEPPFIPNQETSPEIEHEPSFIPPQSTPQSKTIINLENLPHDPGERHPISSFPFNLRDEVRRRVIAKQPCRPRRVNFPQTNIGGMRSFNKEWYDVYDWLEYNEKKDAAFCFPCYLFSDKVVAPGGDKFIEKGFNGWNRAHERFRRHIGEVGSVHRQSQEKYDFFTNPKTSIVQNIENTSTESQSLYKARLTYSLKCLRFILRQGIACRGHDESEESSNRGNFLELLAWLAENNPEVDKVVLKNAPKNHQMIAPMIQKDLIDSCAKETIKLVIQDLDNDYFGILADESGDVSHKEQLALCLRYVDKKGKVCERFLGLAHVKDTTSLSLKNAIEKLLKENSLSMSKVRGQGYDGASNMRGEINGLKTLIMNDTPSAYYIHCFAHQLQLTLVAVAKENVDCVWLFEQLGYLLNAIGVSCKRNEMIRDVQAQKVVEALDLGEIEDGKGLNQELGLGRPGDTRWGSHYKTILNVIALYSTITDVLVMVGSNPTHKNDRVQAQTALNAFESFEFVFMAHLMKVIFGYTDELSQALQRRDQDIVNAMSLVRLTKERLQKIRDDGWVSFLDMVSLFCAKHGVDVPNMCDFYVPRTRSKRFYEKITNIQRYRVDMFLSVLDMQLQELNNRFNESNMELLTCMACLSPVNSFACFDKEKVIRLAEFYPHEFSATDLMRLDYQLDHFIDDMRSDIRFRQVKELGQLSVMLVETNKHRSYELVFLLLKLVLILPVATASVERVFSAMTYVKCKLRNSMGDPFLNNTLVTFIERDLFLQVSDDDVMYRFQDMRPRKVLLPPRSK